MKAKFLLHSLYEIIRVFNLKLGNFTQVCVFDVKLKPKYYHEIEEFVTLYLIRAISQMHT